jgi:hypothetical protein
VPQSSCRTPPPPPSRVLGLGGPRRERIETHIHAHAHAQMCRAFPWIHHSSHARCLPAALPTRRFKLKKVVGGGDALTAKGLTVKAHAFTASARAAIEGNGGTCVVLPKTAPAEAAPAAAE